MPTRLESAVARARSLQAAADAGWPDGFDPVAVHATALACLEIFEAHATTPEAAAGLLAQLGLVEPAGVELEVAW